MGIGINQVFLVGCLGQDPQTRSTPKGTKVSELNLATTESTRDNASGNFKKHAEWHRIVAFGSDAEFAENYLKKGSKLAIVGRLQTQKYEDKSGVTRWVTKIIAEKLSSLDSNDVESFSDSELPPTNDSSHRVVR